LTGIPIPTAPLALKGYPKIVVPKNTNRVPIMADIPPIGAHRDTPAETRVPDDCPCVKMLFALITQIPKRKEIVHVVTKGTLMEIR
jgi:hypothetical protein